MKNNANDHPSRFRFVYFALIGVVNFVIYLPSFFHMPRSDQLIYLYHTAGSRQWADLALRAYDLNRTLALPDAQLLFRPLLYVFLGTEKWLFGYNFVAWQMTGFLLHLAVIYCLLKLLLRVHPSHWAYLFTAFFSTLLISFEMVIFHHVNAYLIFSIMILICLRGCARLQQQDRPRVSTVAAVSLALLTACLTYELGCVFAVIVAVYVFMVLARKPHSPLRTWPRRMALSLLVLAPALLYLGWSYVNLRQHGIPLGSGTAALKQGFQAGPTAWVMLKAMGWWIFGGLFPGLLKVSLANRTGMYIINPWDTVTLETVLSYHTFSLVFGVALLGVFIRVALASASRHFLKKRGPLTLLILTWLLACVFTVVVTRANVSGGMVKIQINTYYAYFVWLLLTVCLYLMVDWGRLKTPREVKWARVMAALTIAVIMVNSATVLTMNGIRAEAYTSWRRLAARIERLIAAEEPARRVTFRVPPDAKHNPVLPWVRLPGRDPQKKFTYFEILYPLRCDAADPRYVFQLSGNDHQMKVRKDAP
jgi:hypothetical protein